MEIEIIAGLGNPGRKYEKTRHNLGFRVVDLLLEASRGAAWKTLEDLEVAEIVLEGAKRYLVKPQSFMNRSGEPLASFMRYRNIAAQKLVVVHDELDLPLGALRLKVGGGDGGHNGIRSVCQLLGTKEFARVRLGIGRPVANGSDDQVADWVLGRFSSEEQSVADALVQKASSAVGELLRGTLASAQRVYNTD